MNENIRLDNSTVFNPQTGEFGTLPQILLFSTDRNILTDGTPATVNWTVSNATTIKLNNETVEPTGSKEFHTTDTLTITIYASNEVGDAKPQTLSIDIDRTKPKIHFFNATPEVATKGSPVQLNWNVEGAYKVQINDTTVEVGASSKVLTLGENGVFTLKAMNYFGFSAESVASVTVFPPPIIESLYVPTPNFSRHANIDQVALKTPSLNISTPILNSSRKFDFTIPLNLSTIEINKIKPEYLPPFSYWGISKAIDTVKKIINRLKNSHERNE